MCFLGPTRVDNPNGISIGSTVFAQLTAKGSILYNGFHFPQNCAFPWGIWTPSNTWFPRPTRVLNLNGVLIGSSILAGLTTAKDRQTDRETDRPRFSAGNSIGRIYVRSTATRPNNNVGTRTQHKCKDNLYKFITT